MFGKSRFIKIKELQSFAFIEAKLFMRELFMIDVIDSDIWCNILTLLESCHFVESVEKYSS